MNNPRYDTHKESKFKLFRNEMFFFNKGPEKPINNVLFWLFIQQTNISNMIIVVWNKLKMATFLVGNFYCQHLLQPIYHEKRLWLEC